MYNPPDIKNKMLSLVEEPYPSLSNIVKEIIAFIPKTHNDNIRKVFKTIEFEKVGEKLGFWIQNQEYYFGCKNRTEENNKSIQELLNVLKTVVNTNQLNDDVKKEFILNFATHFANCSDDEEYCDGRIYVIVKNIGKPSDYVGKDEYTIVVSFSSLEDAIQHVDNTYISCCDDERFAEEVWFALLCNLQNNNYDICMNFCKTFEIDAQGI